MTLASLVERVRTLEAGTYDHSLRVFFLRSFTIEGIEPHLKRHLLESGIRPELEFGDYGVIEQQILDPSSRLRAFAPELVVVTLYPDVPIDRIRTICSGLLESTTAVIALHTAVPDGPAALADNLAIHELAAQHAGRVFVTDWDTIVRRLGEDAAFDRRFWYMSKAPFKAAFLDAYARDLAKAARALKGKAKKVLALDCDGTLWGGVVGEDGLDGIALDPHSYPGNIYHDVQAALVALSQRGVLLVLVSKNNPDDVWQVLDSHPHCLLKREHIAAERINWEDKASNLRSLAAELDLGIDSFVFLDDNPVECDLVRQLLPAVTVLQVPSPIHTYRDVVARTGLFDTLAVTAEDRQRTRMYRTERERKKLEDTATNVEAYLAGLEMVATIHEVPASEIPRVAQLTQKTNQFNLTTRRYSESQIAAFADSPDSKVFSLTVRDRFGELGLTGVLIARRDGTTAVVDSLLLSCRVLGRRLEHAFLAHCLARIDAAWQPTTWQAEFLRTQKNQQVQDFWRTVGFDEVTASETHKQYATSSRTSAAIPFITIQE